MDIGDGRNGNGVGRDGSPARKRKMILSEALRWAWTDELPKMAGDGSAAPNGYASAWGAILRFGELHSMVDRQPNRFGCIPFDHAGWPHADALAIAHAVEALAECMVDVPEAWNPMPELLSTIDAGLAGRAISDALERATVERGGARYFRTRPDVLIVRHAILGLMPDWRLPSLPEMKFETWENGRHRWYVRRQVRVVEGQNPDGTDYIVAHDIEADGWSSRLQRPVTGAYRKTYLDPSPVPAMVARAEYEIFCAAMAMLFDTLAGRLETIDLVAADLPAQPWTDSGEMAGESRAPKILADLRSVRRAKTAGKTAVKSKAKMGAKSRANPA